MYVIVILLFASESTLTVFAPAIVTCGLLSIVDSEFFFKPIIPVFVPEAGAAVPIL